jgi:sugar phosphate permease
MPSETFSHPPPKSPRLRRVQITSLTLLVAFGAINYIDRATLAIANPLIREELGLSVADMGLLLSAFLGAYALAQLPAGLVVDRFGPRLVLTLSLAMWSLAQMLGGFVRGFSAFFATRVGLGIGEAPQFPSNVRVVCDWFGKNERGSATGVWNASSTLGTAVSAPLLTFLMLHFGWRMMFVIMGVAGMGVAAVFYAVYRNPSQCDLTVEERAYLADGGSPAPREAITLREWTHLFRFRTTWGMICGFSGTVYLLWIYNAWLPGYLQMERHFTISKTGWVAAIPFVFGIFGSLSGGQLCDYLVRRGVPPMRSRKWPMAIALLGGSLFTALAAVTPGNTLAISFIAAAMFLLYLASSAAWAMAPVAAPGNSAASLGAVQNFGGFCGGTLAPTVTGFIVQKTSSFAPALHTGAAVGTVATLLYCFLVRGPITPRGADTVAAPKV